MYESRLDVMAMIIVSKKNENENVRRLFTDDRKITDMINHSHSFCYMEDTWLEYLALSKSIYFSRGRVGGKQGHWLRYSWINLPNTARNTGNLTKRTKALKQILSGILGDK